MACELMAIWYFQNLSDANDMLQKQVDNLNRQLEEAITQMDRTTEDYAKLKVHFRDSLRHYQTPWYRN